MPRSRCTPDDPGFGHRFCRRRAHRRWPRRVRATSATAVLPGGDRVRALRQAGTDTSALDDRHRDGSAGHARNPSEIPGRPPDGRHPHLDLARLSPTALGFDRREGSSRPATGDRADIRVVIVEELSPQGASSAGICNRSITRRTPRPVRRRSAGYVPRHDRRANLPCRCTRDCASSGVPLRSRARRHHVAGRRMDRGPVAVKLPDR